MSVEEQMAAKMAMPQGPAFAQLQNKVGAMSVEEQMAAKTAMPMSVEEQMAQSKTAVPQGLAFGQLQKKVGALSGSAAELGAQKGSTIKEEMQEEIVEEPEQQFVDASAAADEALLFSIGGKKQED